MGFKIIDKTSYSRKDKKRTPRVLKVVSEQGFSYKIFRHLDYPDTWLLTCKDLGIEKKELRTDNFNDAKDFAEMTLIAVMSNRIKQYEITINDLITERGKHEGDQV